MKNRGRAGDELAYVIKTKIVAGKDMVKQGVIECFPLKSWNADFKVTITPSGEEYWSQPRESDSFLQSETPFLYFFFWL